MLLCLCICQSIWLTHLPKMSLKPDYKHVPSSFLPSRRWYATDLYIGHSCDEQVSFSVPSKKRKTFKEEESEDEETTMVLEDDNTIDNDDELIIRKKDYPAKKKAATHKKKTSLAMKKNSPTKKKGYMSSALGVQKKGVWFASQAHAKKWDGMLKRSIIHENFS